MSNSSVAIQKMRDSGRLGEEQRFVRDKLARYGPCTGMELHEKLVIVEDDHKSKILGPERVRKRLPELVDLGVVVRIDRNAVCNVTGNCATRWDTV